MIETQEANNEELKSANEEIQSSNEEMQSINEEMETAKEELQSTNEELTTVNEELQTRNFELATANNDLSNLLSSVQIPLVMVDGDLRLRRFTPAADKLLNLIPTDVGRPLLDIKPNIEVHDLQRVLRDVIDNLRVVEQEVHDRQGRSYSMWIRPYRTSENKIDGAVMAFVDVSALKRSLEQSRDLREYAEAIASTVREPFLALDEKFCVITANAPFYSAFGFAPEKVANRPLFEIGNGEFDLPQIREWLMNKQDPFLQGLEVERTFGAAGVKTLSINMRRIPSTGKARMILIALEDTSARRVAERSLRDTQASFSAFTREAPVGIVQSDQDGQCTYINPHACRIAAVSAEEALGHGWMKHFHADDSGPVAARLHHVRVTKDGFSTDLRLMVPSLGVTWAHLIAIPLLGNDGAFNGYLAALTDITERKDLEDRLSQAQKMEAIGRLAGGVAHDFNNMLTALSSYAAQLLNMVPENHAAHKPTVQINKVVEQAALVTRQLLAFSRKQLMRPQRIDLNNILREMHDLLQRLLGESIEITLSLSPAADSVVVDPGQLQQVILNVAINARDAMPDGGHLSLATSLVTLDAAAAKRERLDPGSFVVLAVSDTGAGMDQRTLDRAFEPFFTTKPPGEGTGLGLSMVYGIVQQSGGNITVESQPGTGTTLRIYLPQGSAAMEGPHPVLASEDGYGDETVLLVEDAAMVRSLVRELLEHRGYTVLEARDPHEAISIAENHEGDIHLLLTDLVMPRIGGHELAKRLSRRRKKMRVIYMSGYSGESLHAVEKEANFLEKPFKPDTLAALIRKVLDR